MAGIVSTTGLTIGDVAKRLDDDGRVADIVEQCNQNNEFLDLMPFIECNDGSGHKTTVRSGLPSASWRILNAGVPSSKSQTLQVRDSTGMLETFAQVDDAVLVGRSSKAEIRKSEEKPFIEVMNQESLKALLYNDVAVNPARPHGLAPRFSSTTAENGVNIIKGDPSASGSDQTSIWCMVMGENTVHGLYPQNSQAGLLIEDLGYKELFDANGNQFMGWKTHYKWDLGLCVRDWRYIVRICNIDTSALTKNASAGADLLDLLAQALEILPDVNSGDAAFFCNRTIRSFLRRQTMNKTSNTLTMDEVQRASGGVRRVVAFDGIPIFRCDQILSTEAIVA